MTTAAAALDNGPQVIACDHRFGGRERTAKCLVVGSGMNQGVSWIVFEAGGRRWRHLDSVPSRIERVTPSGKVVSAQRITRSDATCRPGGATADVFAWGNGDRVCLYWP